MTQQSSNVIPFPAPPAPRVMPDWWADRYEPDWAVVNAAHAEMWPEYERGLDAPSAPVLRVVK